MLKKIISDSVTRLGNLVPPKHKAVRRRERFRLSPGRSAPAEHGCGLAKRRYGATTAGAAGQENLSRNHRMIILMQELLINRALIVINMIFICGTAFSTDRYVSLNGTNDSANGYTNWLGAATNIQWAVNVAQASETVRVTNGIYNLTNQISITNGITLRSVNGRDITFVNGNYPLYTNRCLWVSNVNAVVDGFTISNGFANNNVLNGAYGGGVYISSGTVQNCIIRENIATSSTYTAQGGGVYTGPWGNGGNILNSSICFNSVTGFSQCPGGGIYMMNSIVSNCAIYSNTALSSSPGSQGGGVYIYVGGTLVQCNIYGNRANDKGAGVYGGPVTSCTISNNIGAVGAYVAGAIKNCLICNNGNGGIYMYQAPNSINSCTVINNNMGIGTMGAPLIENTISYNNGPWDWKLISGSVTNFPFFSNCCFNTGVVLTNGTGNITNPPLCVNTNIGNYRLANNSPCINTGINRDWMTNAFDLDGRTRIRYRIVDMGAYERVDECTIYHFH